jgi:hypothetical protein
MSVVPGTTDFTDEIATYERELPRLLREDEGRYVAIVGDKLLGTYDDAGQAWKAGLPHRPDGTVFVRQVLAEPRAVMLPFMVG